MKQSQAVSIKQLAHSKTKTRYILRTSFLFVACIFLSLQISSCSKKVQTLSLSGQTMGTTYHITIVDEPSLDLAQHQSVLQNDIDNKLRYINQLMSTYIPDSEISRFNQTSDNTWFQLSAETFSVIEYSLYLSELSQGKFDITVSPLIDLWGFGAKGNTDFPSDEAIAKAKLQVGWKDIVLDKALLRIKKNKPLRIDLSAIAKGYGVDAIAQLLEDNGVKRYLVEIGGEIRVKGTNADNIFWRLGIETPSFFQSQAQKVIRVEDQSVATSGDYRNFFEKNGIRYSHTIDPDTGKPVIHNIASITVINESAMKADGLATAFMALGEDKALTVADQYGIPVYILQYNGDTFTESFSKNFAPYLH